MDFSRLRINIDVAGFLICVDDFNLVDDPSIVFSHIDFDRLSRYLLFGSFEASTMLTRAFSLSCLSVSKRAQAGMVFKAARNATAVKSVFISVSFGSFIKSLLNGDDQRTSD